MSASCLPCSGLTGEASPTASTEGPTLLGRIGQLSGESTPHAFYEYSGISCIYRDTGGLASNSGAEDGEKSTWYPLFVHALNNHVADDVAKL